MTLDIVKKIIADHLSVKVENLTENTILAEDLNADSLDFVEILTDLENKFQISIPDEDVAGVKTIKDLVDYIDQKVNK